MAGIEGSQALEIEMEQIKAFCGLFSFTQCTAINTPRWIFRTIATYLYIVGVTLRLSGPSKGQHCHGGLLLVSNACQSSPNLNSLAWIKNDKGIGCSTQTGAAEATRDLRRCQSSTVSTRLHES